ncbi:MAG TPA: hypothetical protein VIX89_04075 [Bryobacteraceae bacterium]
MRSLWLGILLAAVESLAFGQLDSDTLTVSASRPLNAKPDQLVLTLNVTTPVSTGLDEVVASLKSVGITAANFSYVSSPRDNATLSWSFTLAVPFSKVPATAVQLMARNVQFYPRNFQVSAASLPAQQCQVPVLMADVKASAKNLADAAGLVVGEVVAMSDVSSVSSISFQKSPDPVTGVGLTYAISLANFVLTAPRQPQQVTCSLTVKFKLLRYHY